MYHLSVPSVDNEAAFHEAFMADRDFSGMAFTQAYFVKQDEVLPFMSQFPLEKLHFWGQEGITSPCESNIYAQPQEIVDLWLQMAVKLCEREDLLSWSEHPKYIGRKKIHYTKNMPMQRSANHAVGAYTALIQAALNVRKIVHWANTVRPCYFLLFH